ncbi:MAG: hypothetical protein ABH813_01885 [Patescibacteria group bacterium]
MQNYNSKVKNLRQKYLKFIYKSYSWKILNGNLEISFDFVLRSFMRRRVSPDVRFKPKIIIKNIDKKRLAKIGKRALDNLIFHAGLIEIPSYWKATCSPVIEIQAGALTQEQINWWKNLFIDGMGQFYYENKIDWRTKDFLKINCLQKTAYACLYRQNMEDRYLVPFAGGRDSIVTLEGLKKQKKGSPVGLRPREISLFTVNAINRIQKTVRVSGIKKQIIVKRIIDKKLLDLNRRGFLNGHTPFTGVLSFISVLCAVIFDYKNIVFSNEKSAEEGNVKYLGKTINHQWAKSAAFEKMFKDYAKIYLAKDINYFGYLRKYGELEISKMLTRYPQYFPVFSSCNAGMRIRTAFASPELRRGEERWCGKCPKCLFVYMALYPFLKEKELLKIFGKDIFENRKLLPIMRQLIGESGFKPFECVGTKAESRKAFDLCLKKVKKSGKIPYLLTYELKRQIK